MPFFYDPVLRTWKAPNKGHVEMLLKSARDLKIAFSEFTPIRITAPAGWVATYIFSRRAALSRNKSWPGLNSRTIRSPSNQDSFDLWKWSRQPWLTGHLFGWTPVLQKKVR